MTGRSPPERIHALRLESPVGERSARDHGLEVLQGADTHLHAGWLGRTILQFAGEGSLDALLSGAGRNLATLNLDQASITATTSFFCRPVVSEMLRMISVFVRGLLPGFFAIDFSPPRCCVRRFTTAV